MAIKTNERKSRPVQASGQAGDGNNSRASGRRRASGNPSKHTQAGGPKDYAVIFERSETGYSAYSPDIAGVIATGATLSDTKQRFRSALRMHLEAMRDCGERIPQPATKVDYVAA